MRKLFLAFIASSALFLTACSSCLGHTPTPGEAAPQAVAPDDTLSMVSTLESLLKAGDGAQFYAVLANVPEKMMELTDSVQARQYLTTLCEFMSSHQEQINALVSNTSDALAAQELPGLVQFFSDPEKLQTFIGQLPAFAQPANDVAGTVTEGASGTEEN